MPISQRPAPKTMRASEEDKDEAHTELLVELASTLAAKNDLLINDDAQPHTEFYKIIKRSLHQKKDEILYDALARSESLNHASALFLKEAIEQTVEVTQIERDGKKMEINAFIIPLFVGTYGGLESSRCFQDQEAFELLRKSIQSQNLESDDATVVLINHAYHLNEVDGITYSHLHDMLRDAFSAMTEKRLMATPAIERSFFGWPDNPFASEDKAIELRFLIGFTLKAVDDPFYAVPAEETAADDYFEARQQRFQQWAMVATPLVSRCLGLPVPSPQSDDHDTDIHFLYQDLFHSGKERGITEYFTLQMISELNQALQSLDTTVDQVKAVIGTVKSAGETLLEVHLYIDEESITYANRPLGALADHEVEYADIYQALQMIGLTDIWRAKGFDNAGQPIDPVRY